jgi:predicted transcriptional regulator
MSVQLTVEQEVELTHLAQSVDRTTDELAQEAVAEFLAGRKLRVASILRAREQVAAGQTTPHEEVFAALKQRMGW